jgi:hypothetical protein
MKLNFLNLLLSMVTVTTKVIPLSSVAAYQLVDRNPCFDENSCLFSHGNVRYWHAPTKQHSIAFQKTLNFIFTAMRILILLGVL